MSDARSQMVHLLRRAGFGPAPGEVESRLADGYAATVQRLVEPGTTPEGTEAADQALGSVLDANNLEDLRAWWIYRMVHSGRPLVEKMVLFWHGHFATGNAKVDSGTLMYRQNQLFRDKGLGTFGELLSAVAIDPAMLRWLDGAGSKKGRPNENFAREVMELFTLGSGRYTEKDVQEAARAFTGWEVRDGQPFFNANTHDAGPKTVLGHAGDLTGNDVLRILADHPATPDRLVRKLFAFFVHDLPEPSEISPLVQIWRKTGGSVREVLRALFLAPAFRSQRARGTRIKSPAELVVGAMRALGGTVTPRAMGNWMGRMGQTLFDPPSVKGWDEGPAWLSTSTLFERMNFAEVITTQRGHEGTSHVDPSVLLRGAIPTTPAEWLDRTVHALLDGKISETTRAAVLTYLETPDPTPPGKPPRPFSLDPRTLDEKGRGMLRILLSSPEYQLT